MTSSNKTVSRQKSLSGQHAKSMTSEGNSALLPANVDRRPPLHVNRAESESAECRVARENSPVLTHNFAACGSQETVHFHSGAFSSGCNVTVNFHYH